MFNWCEWGIIISNYYCNEYFKRYNCNIIFIDYNFFFVGREWGRVGANRSSDQCIFVWLVFMHVSLLVYQVFAVHLKGCFTNQVEELITQNSIHLKSL